MLERRRVLVPVVLLAATVALSACANVKPPAPAPPSSAAVVECRGHVDTFRAAHPRLVVGVRITCIDWQPGFGGWGGWAQGLDVGIVARVGQPTAVYRFVIAHEVGHTWQYQHVTAAAQRATWASIRGRWDFEDYADVFALSIGAGWLSYYACCAPPSPAVIDQLRAARLLP